MEVAVIKKQTLLAAEEAIKLLQSNDAISTVVLVSLARPLLWGAYRLEIISALSKRAKMHLTGW